MEKLERKIAKKKHFIFIFVFMHGKEVMMEK